MKTVPASCVRFGLFIVIALASLRPASAQTLYGSLVGTVSDETGLAVPGAAVTITHTETNQVREATTNASGGYTFPNIATGTYQVQVALPGFHTFTTRNIAVRQNVTVRVDARLTVGALEESIVVSGTAAVLQTESAAVQSQTTSEQIESLPTSGRAFHSFMTLMPGVAQPYSVQAGGINNPSRSMGVSINGQPPSNTVFRIDGATATNQWYQDLQSYSPGLEAIETVAVVTNSFDADQGMAGGAAVNVQVKSGTNTVRGSAFEYLTDARLRNRNYFLPEGRSKGVDYKHVFGGTIGGPIKQDKLFYFVSVETELRTTKDGTVQQENAALTSGLVSVPPADLRAGDFSRTGTPLYDPLTGNPNGTGRVPFAFANCPGVTSTDDPRFAGCNYIPAHRIHPIASSLMSKLVLPGLPGFSNNYYATDSLSSYFHKVDSKVTYTPGSQLNLNGRIGFLLNDENSKGLFPPVDGAEYNPLSIGRHWQANVGSGSLAATSILSSNMVVDGVFGITRYHSKVGPEGPVGKCWGAEFDIPNACQPPHSRDTATPVFNMSGWQSLGRSQVRDYLDTTYQWGGNVGWTKGSHNVKFGFDAVMFYMNHYETQVGSFTFNGAATALNGGASPNNFNTFAQFLLGLPSTRTMQVMTPLLGTDSGLISRLPGGADPEFPATLRSAQHGLYIRDQWQLNRKMTASVGLRWEYYPFPRRADRGLEIFDFATNRLQICGVAGANEQVCDIKVQKDLFTPRLGWAYRPTDTIVIRAGFSRNPQNDNVGRNLAQAFPTVIAISEVGPNTFTPAGSLSTGVPVIEQLDLTAGSVALPRGAGITTIRDRYVRGTITSYNLTFQKLLPFSLSAQVGYVANRQSDLTRNQNLNYGQIGGGSASQPYRSITTSSINVFAPLGRVKYDSLQASLTRRMANGLQFTAAYTAAKATDWWADDIAIPEYWHLNKGPQGGGSRSSSTTPHKLDMSVMYELPFGQGRRFINEGALARIVGGWQVNAFFTAYTGDAFTITSSSASLNAPGSGQRADQVKDTVEILGFRPNQAYFDVTAFRPVTEARFGTSAVNSLRGPGVANLDMSVFRTFAVRNLTLQLKLEAFNVTNTPHFAIPNNLNVSNLRLNADGSVRDLNGFGVINRTQNLGREFDERYLRIGLRLGF